DESFLWNDGHGTQSVISLLYPETSHYALPLLSFQASGRWDFYHTLSKVLRQIWKLQNRFRNVDFHNYWQNKSCNKVLYVELQMSLHLPLAKRSPSLGKHGYRVSCYWYQW